MKLPIASLALWLSLASPLQAGLEWETTSQRTTVHPVQLKTRLSFPFRNTGDQPVRILKVNASCGCITTPPTQKVYNPGEDGELPVTFLLRGRNGRQQKYLSVITSDAPQRPTRLDIEINIPPGYKPSTQRLAWEAGTPSHAPQSCRFVNQAKEPIELMEAISTITSVKTELKTIRAGYEYELVVKPDDGLSNIRAFVKVTTRPPDGLTESKYYKVYLYIGCP